MEIWIADTDELKPFMNLENLTALLPEHEQEHARKYRFDADSLRFVTGRILIRSLAVSNGGSRDTKITFPEYGKPRFFSENLPHFNLSHSGKKVVLAYGDIPLGVDIEECREINYREFLSVFGETERRLLDSSESPLQTFYRLWTVREAFSKEEGIGLSVFEKNDVRIDYKNETIRYNGKNLQFRNIALPGYALSLCAEDIPEFRIKNVTAEMWNEFSAPSRNSLL